MFRCPLGLTRDDFLQNRIGTEFMTAFDAVEPNNGFPYDVPHIYKYNITTTTNITVIY